MEKRRIQIAERCKDIGRSPDEIRIAAGYTLWLDPTEEQIARMMMRLKMRGELSAKEAEQIVKNAPSTPEAHIEAMQELINRGLRIFMFMGSVDDLKIFKDKVISKLK
ncbi:MAG: hypothetical protein ACFFAS_07055 [Promethearchaeota archaeon]